jgi:hypothetical protein
MESRMTTRKKPMDFKAFTSKLLDAHTRGASDDVDALLKGLPAFDDEVLMLDTINSASFIWWDDLPTPDNEDDLGLFEHIIDEERLEALEGGEALTPEEKAAWTRAAVEAIFTEDVDADVYPAWCLATLADDTGRSAVVAFLVKGYSRSGISVLGVGVFDDKAAALAGLKALGITSQEDFEQVLVKLKGS